MPDVPLPYPVGSVARSLEHLGQGHALLVQLAQVGRSQARRRITAREVGDPRLVGIQARQQGSPGRAAAGGIVVLGKAQTIGRQPIEVRSL